MSFHCGSSMNFQLDPTIPMASSSLTSPAAAQTPAQYSPAINVANFVCAKLSCDRINNSNNYIWWKEQMLCLLESQGLVGFSDGKAPPPLNDDEDYVAWRRSDWLVKGWILGALSDEIVKNVVNLDCARDVWLGLQNRFSKSECATSPPAAHQEKDWHEYLALYRGAMSGAWDTTKHIIDQNPEAIKARVASNLHTPLHIAVSTGNSTSFVSKLVELMFDIDSSSIGITDKAGYNPLHIAALTGNLNAAQILVKRLPHLLYVSSHYYYNFPVHLAAQAGHRQTVEFLISHTRDDLPTNPYAAQSGLMLVIFLIGADFFDIALDLVERYPDLARMKHPLTGTALKRISLKATAFSVDTKLNLWERLVYTCIQVEMESQVLQTPTPQSFDIENQTCCPLPVGDNEPRRWRKVVRKLHSTLCKVINHLVPRTKKVDEKILKREQALRLVKCLCKHMESLKYEEAKAIYTDAVLVAAELGIHEIIQVIVETFPAAIYTRDADTNQNFLHLAVRNRCEKVFNLMYQSSNHRCLYSNKVDSSGNSILHLAATLAPPHKLNLVSGAALQMQRELQWFKEADKFISPYTRGRTNNAGKTAEMIFTEEHRNLKTEGEIWMKDTANSCTIAAALIATVVFAAAITVPGGNESDTGYPVFSGSSAFTIFAVSDAVSLFTSTTSLLMFLSILTSRYAEEDFLNALPKRLCIGFVTLFLSILFMMVAFSSTLYLVFGRKKAWVLIPVVALTSLPISSYVLLQFPLIIALISSTYGRGIFGKQSDHLFH